MLSKILKVLLFFVAAPALFAPPSSNAATEEQIENSIALGLQWLATQQAVDGSWSYYTGWPSICHDPATTALVVLKFEDRAKELGLNPFGEEYLYHENVIDGLDYLFGQAFDASAAGAEGIAIGGCLTTYNTAAAMMAIAASNAPDRIVPIGPFDGLTFQDFLGGLQDWMTYAQNVESDNYDCDVGGWGYDANYDGWSDQSNSGYATLGLGFAAAPAPNGFGLPIPESVLDRLDLYVDNVQDPVGGDPYDYDGGSWYEPCSFYKWVNILKTGNLLYEMALVGDNVGDERVRDAIEYIERHWNDTGPQPEFTATSLGWMDSYQAMFTMMKGFEAFGIDTIDVGVEIDWFDAVSDVIVLNQNPAGYFEYINPMISEGEESVNLRTAWAMLTLERVVPTVALPVYVDIKPGSCPNPINFKEKGVLPAAVLGTEEFDVTQIDPASILLGREGVECQVPPLRWSHEDVATPFEGELCDCHEYMSDGYLDLTVKFKTPEIVDCLELFEVAGQTLPLTFSGNLKEEFGGTPFEGQDCVRVLKAK
jgi:hypothetical protein